MSDLPSKYFGRPIAEILTSLRDDSAVGSKVHEEIKAALFATSCVELIKSIDRHEQAASKLTKVILALDVILGLITLISGAVTIWQFMHQPG